MNVQEEKTVQVSASLLASLTTSVNELRDSVSQLRNENGSLRRELKVAKEDLRTLQRNAGVEFLRFTALPVELRRMIWQFACLAPQTIIISCDGASRSKINSVVESCREARDVAAGLQLDYYLASTDHDNHDFEGLINAGLVKNYINLHVDTVWLTREEESIILPENIVWICGKCRNEMTGDCNSNNCVSYGYFGPNKIQRLAINYSTWLDPSPMFIMGTMELLMRYQVQEALLVVGDFKSFEGERDTTFVTPPQIPLLTAHSLSGTQKDSPSAFAITWQDLEDNTSQYMQDYKDNRATARQSAVDSGEVASLEEIDDSDREELRDLSAWKVPKVKFVVARKSSEDWILNPKGSRFLVR